MENLARDRVQGVVRFVPMCVRLGQANAAVLHALISPGERLLGLDLANSDHLTMACEANPAPAPARMASPRSVDPATRLIIYGCGAGHHPPIPPESSPAGRPTRRLLDRGVPVDRRRGRTQLLVDMAHFAVWSPRGCTRRRCRTRMWSTTVHKTLGGSVPPRHVVIGAAVRQASTRHCFPSRAIAHARHCRQRRSR